MGAYEFMNIGISGRREPPLDNNHVELASHLDERKGSRKVGPKNWLWQFEGWVEGQILSRI